MTLRSRARIVTGVLGEATIRELEIGLTGSADGSVVHASESQHSEMFYALRGGGGNFGIVTKFELAVHPLGPPCSAVSSSTPAHKRPRS